MASSVVIKKINGSVIGNTPVPVSSTFSVEGTFVTDQSEILHVECRIRNGMEQVAAEESLELEGLEGTWNADFSGVLVPAGALRDLFAVMTDSEGEISEENGPIQIKFGE